MAVRADISVDVNGDTAVVQHCLHDRLIIAAILLTLAVFVAIAPKLDSLSPGNRPRSVTPSNYRTWVLPCIGFAVALVMLGRKRVVFDRKSKTATTSYWSFRWWCAHCASLEGASLVLVNATVQFRIRDFMGRYEAAVLGQSRTIQLPVSGNARCAYEAADEIARFLRIPLQAQPPAELAATDRRLAVDVFIPIPKDLTPPAMPEGCRVKMSLQEGELVLELPVSGWRRESTLTVVKGLVLMAALEATGLIVYSQAIPDEMGSEFLIWFAAGFGGIGLLVAMLSVMSARQMSRIQEVIRLTLEDLVVDRIVPRRRLNRVKFNEVDYSTIVPKANFFISNPLTQSLPGICLGCGKTRVVFGQGLEPTEMVWVYDTIDAVLNYAGGDRYANVAMN